jgi:hypothetical protein
MPSSPLFHSFNLARQSAKKLSLAATPIVAVLALGAGPGEVGLLGSALRRLTRHDAQSA